MEIKRSTIIRFIIIGIILIIAIINYKIDEAENQEKERIAASTTVYVPSDDIDAISEYEYNDPYAQYYSKETTAAATEITTTTEKPVTTVTTTETTSQETTTSNETTVAADTSAAPENTDATSTETTN